MHRYEKSCGEVTFKLRTKIEKEPTGGGGVGGTFQAEETTRTKVSEEGMNLV